jgi:23S rRNA pseudoU1915 N3-methylase RlmH
MMHTKDNKRALRTLKLSEIERQQKQQEQQKKEQQAAKKAADKQRQKDRSAALAKKKADEAVAAVESAAEAQRQKKSTLMECIGGLQGIWCAKAHAALKDLSPDDWARLRAAAAETLQRAARAKVSQSEA